MLHHILGVLQQTLDVDFFNSRIFKGNTGESDLLTELVTSRLVGRGVYPPLVEKCLIEYSLSALEIPEAALQVLAKLSRTCGFLPPHV